MHSAGLAVIPYPKPLIIEDYLPLHFKKDKVSTPIIYEESDFEIIESISSQTELEELQLDAHLLTNEKRLDIELKVQEASIQELKKFIEQFSENNKKTFQTLNILNLSATVGLFIYTGPLTAIFSKILIDTTQMGIVYTKLKKELEYFPSDSIAVAIYQKEVKDILLKVAKKTFLDITGQEPKSLEEAKKLYKQSVLISHPDRKGNQDIFLKIDEAYKLYKKYTNIST